MPNSAQTCEMSVKTITDVYFMENRARLLDVAAFLDRLDRAAEGDPDFRIDAFKRAVSVLAEAGPGRAERIQMLFSDKTREPKPKLDQKAACGAYRPGD